MRKTFVNNCKARNLLKTSTFRYFIILIIYIYVHAYVFLPDIFQKTLVISTMGQSLQRAAQWTSAKDGSGGKLEFNTANEELLNTIIAFVDGFGSKNPEESKLVFKKPLTWKSSLKPNQVSAAGVSDR